MQFEALSQSDDDERNVEIFDSMVRTGPWKLATLDGLLARNPVPFSAVLVHDRGAALELTCARLDRAGKPITAIAYNEVIDPARVVDALHAGATDYIAWPIDSVTLIERLRIAAGRAARRLRNENTGRLAQDRVETLTVRERQVLQCLTNGDSSKAIARELGISGRTVEVHRAKLLGKLGVANSLQAAILAIKSDLF